MLSLEFTKHFHTIIKSLHIMLISTLPKEDIIDIDIPDRICSLTFDVDEFSGLFLHPSISSIIHSKSEYIINGTLTDF